MNSVSKNFDEWCSNIFDDNTISKVKSLKLNNPDDFQDSFYRNLEFGTGGMRGIMGVGPNRVNKYTFGISQSYHPNEIYANLVSTYIVNQNDINADNREMGKFASYLLEKLDEY